MTYNLTITETAFRRLVDELTANAARIIVCPAGLSRLPNRMEFLVHLIRNQPAQADSATPLVLFMGADNAACLTAICQDALLRRDDGATAVCLAIGIRNAAGNLAGICHTLQGTQPLHTLTIVGAGLPRMSWRGSEVVNPPLTTHYSPTDLWSRTIGALGEVTWQQLTSLHIGIIGCGRTGSLIATALTHLGVQHLTLIDPDTLEPHNLGEMDAVTDADLGKPKVEAISAYLHPHPFTLSPFHPFTTVPDSILSLSSLVAIKRTDILFCCVDNAVARLATAFLAKLYLKIILDIGTGIFFNDQFLMTNPPVTLSPSHRRSMGADIRLVLPDRCLLCFGGIADLEQARAELLDSHHTSSITHPDWRQQRAGSLRSLNTVAVGFALRLLEDFIGGRIRESVWLHLEIDDAGIPTLERRTPPANPHCPLCALTAHGDEGIGALRAVLG